jgi:hypothetical protein
MAGAALMGGITVRQLLERLSAACAKDNTVADRVVFTVDSSSGMVVQVDGNHDIDDIPCWSLAEGRNVLTPAFILTTGDV